MSVLDPPRPAPQLSPEPAGPATPATAAAPVSGHDETVAAPTPTWPLVVAAALSASAAGYLCGGLFVGAAARVLGVAAAVGGAALVELSLRTRRPLPAQLLAGVAILAAAAVVALVGSGTAAGGLGSLIAEAVRNGGIAQPPVPFDPGWRFLLVAGVGLLAAAATALSTGLDRPPLAVFVPAPVLFLALLAESGDTQVLPAAVALGLFVAALAVSFGSDLRRSGATSGRFEAHRLIRGGAALLAMVGLLVGLSHVGFLFPKAQGHHVVPPQRPQPAPVAADRQLFTVKAPEQLPWRMSVLDTYDGRGWLTAPFDTAELVPVDPSRELNPPVSAPSVRVTFTVDDLGGHQLPVLAGATRVDSRGLALDYDPRAQSLRLSDQRATGGMTYTVEAPDLNAVAKGLSSAPPPPADMAAFEAAPAPPKAVQDLIAQAPKGDSFSRLQWVRTQYYSRVVAQGAGQPVDVPPARVAELLDGKPGSPFEITAGETLLARWLGVPARIGYGYMGGDPGPGGVLVVHPRHGATWLEAYFSGYGWVPIPGVPPKASTTLSQEQKNRNSAIRPSSDLTLPVYVPVLEPSALEAYLQVQYWALRVIGTAAAVGLVAWLYPGLIKRLRRMRRRAWARGRGPRTRILTAYADLRDTAHDLRIGHIALTPLEFVDQLREDREHTELAWLLTRSVWGDLGRDLRDEDAEAAEAMAASVRSRMLAGQPAVNRLLALASRRSLQEPYAADLPNLWWRRSSGGRRRRRTSLAKRLLAQGAAVLLLAGCAPGGSSGPEPPTPLPARLVPATNNDAVTYRPEPVAEAAFRKRGATPVVSQGRVFSVRREGIVLGAVEIGSIRQSLLPREREVRADLIDQLGGGFFELRRLGSHSVYVEQQQDTSLYLWLPPRGAYYELFIASKDFQDAGQVFSDLIAYQQGEAAITVAPPPDNRRGFDG